MNIKENIIKVFKGVAEHFGSIIWGIAIGSAVVVIMLSIAVSAAESRCDHLGDRVGLAADYQQKECHLKVDGVWTPVSKLNIQVVK